MIITPLLSVEEVGTKIDSRVIHALQTRTISTKGQSTEYRKGLRDMRYIVMEELKSTAVDEITQDRNQAYTSLVEGIEGELKGKEVSTPPEFSHDEDQRIIGYNQALTDIIENVVKPLYGKS